jgi:hypothetical protein
LFNKALVIRFVRQAEVIEEPVLDFVSAAPFALDAKHFTVDDAPDLGATLAERANPELLPQFEPKLADRFSGRPILLNADLEAGKSRVRRAILETDCPRAIGQLAHVHHLHRIGDVKLAEDVDRKKPQLERFNSYHGGSSLYALS